MSLISDPKASEKPVLEFKSGSFTMPSLHLASNNLSAIKTALEIKIKQAPDFFNQSAIIIDLRTLTKENINIDPKELVNLIRALNFQPIGLRGGNESQNNQARLLNLAILNTPPQTATATKNPATLTAPETHVPDSSASEIITTQVRSGQRIYSKSDLIILSSVSAGAEIISEGNIHVYGPLKGRALAGVLGDKDSRIFCLNLEAELISIAGIYQVSENLDTASYNKPIQIYLNNEKLIIQDL
ncbi:MAG: septum site-determining protein MinC [Methylococcales bacterium]|jgi:septum site-determining protein MinC|nr:septum site-determining protein MinC [Methylococcales bacterium]